MSRIFCLAFLFFMLQACSEDRPGDVLPPAKMRSVLYDLLRADELLTQQALKDSAFARVDKHTELYREVFGIQGITRQQFQHSLRYYEGRPAELREMIEELQQAVEEKQRQGDTTLRPKKRPVDTSIRRLPDDAGL